MFSHYKVEEQPHNKPKKSFTSSEETFTEMRGADFFEFMNKFVEMSVWMCK